MDAIQVFIGLIGSRSITLIRVVVGCIRINKIDNLNSSYCRSILQYGGSRVEHRDEFSSHK